MTLTFFSNFLLHHQTPFCETMVSHLGDGFRFVATRPVPQDRLDMGYSDMSATHYCVNAYADDASYAEAMRLGYESDVVIIGDAPECFIEKRLADNKLTFRYNERFFKKFRWRFHPHAWRVRWERDTRYRKKELYMLCAGAYTARDCRFIRAYPHKTYKWGYFPILNEEPYDELQNAKLAHSGVRILWAGRFLDWKHPEAAVELAERLKAEGIDFSMEMLGTGELREHCEKKAAAKGLSDNITFTGPFEPDEVLRRMGSADIFLFTSDRNEGWGAVLNEAMSSACAVVACREIGSVPYLIIDGENGLVYNRRGDSLYRCVKRLIEDPKYRESMQKNAYDTMRNVWRAETAAERLLHLIDCIRSGREVEYTFGPCSRD